MQKDIYWNNFKKKLHLKQLRWSRGNVLSFGTQVRGFKPGRSRRIFKGEKKTFSTPSVGGEVKAILSHVADLRHVKEP
jgi:hypothetical protein